LIFTSFLVKKTGVTFSPWPFFAKNYKTFEESNQSLLISRSLRVVCLTDLKGSVGLTSTKVRYLGSPFPSTTPHDPSSHFLFSSVLALPSPICPSLVLFPPRSD
jgi:hypothetical protein